MLQTPKKSCIFIEQLISAEADTLDKILMQDGKDLPAMNTKPTDFQSLLEFFGRFPYFYRTATGQRGNVIELHELHEPHLRWPAGPALCKFDRFTDDRIWFKMKVTFATETSEGMTANDYSRAILKRDFDKIAFDQNGFTYPAAHSDYIFRYEYHLGCT